MTQQTAIMSIAGDLPVAEAGAPAADKVDDVPADDPRGERAPLAAGEDPAVADRRLEVIREFVRTRGGDITEELLQRLLDGLRRKRWP